MIKEKRATLSSLIGPMIFTCSFRRWNFSNAYSASFFSCSEIICRELLRVFSGESVLRYSNAYSRETAPIMFGVQASNFSLFDCNSNPSQETSLIVPPPTLRG